MDKKILKASCASFPLAMLAYAAPVLAQAETAPATTGTEVIVVTAQFREQNLQETPIAITAVTGDMLEARSQTNIADVANQAPSVSLQRQGGAFGPSLAAQIRGIGQYDFNPALEPGVGLYVDDVYYATLTGSVFDLLDLERVEILRGPQGTLAGRNSIGGAVRLYSRRPEGDNSGFASLTYGSRDRLDLRASADIGISDSVSFRIAGVSRNQDGYIRRLDFACVNPPGSALNPAVGGVPVGGGVTSSADANCVTAREGDVGYDAFRAQLRFRPDPTIDINIIGDYTRESRNTTSGILLLANNPSVAVRGVAPAVPYDSRFICGRFCNYVTFFSPAEPFLGPVATGYPLFESRGDGRTTYEGWGLSAQIDWDVSDNFQIQSITAYRDYRTRFNNDDDLSPLSVGNGFADLPFWSFSQEIRLNGSFANDVVEYTLGGFYIDQRSFYGGVQDLRYAAIPLQFTGGGAVPAESIAFFGHVAVNVTDQLTLTGGIRYTDESKDLVYQRVNFDGTPNPFLGALDGVTGSYSGDNWDFRVNVSYQWTREVMTYAQFSTGYKGGGVNPRPFNPAQAQPFGPETVGAYEIGIKTDLFDRTVRFNVSAFHNDYSDIQLTLLSCPQFGGPGPCALPANAGNADIDGIEFELAIRPAEGLLIDASLSYVDFDYTFVNPAAGTPGGPGVQLNHVPPYLAEWQWAIGIQYEIPLGDNVGSLTPRLDLSHRSSVFSNAVNAPTNFIGGYELANGRLTYRSPDEDWDVSLEVTNLFDTYYLQSSFDLSGVSGFTSAVPARPREWALTVTRRF